MEPKRHQTVLAAGVKQDLRAHRGEGLLAIHAAHLSRVSLELAEKRAPLVEEVEAHTALQNYYRVLQVPARVEVSRVSVRNPTGPFRGQVLG